MSFTSTGFVFFIAIAALVYYLIPQKRRWTVLLVANFAFYLLSSIKGLVFIAATTIVAFFIALKMQSIEDKNEPIINSETDKAKKKELKAQVKKSKKKTAAIGLVFVFGILAVIKYLNFVLGGVSGIISIFKPNFVFVPIKFLVPLGLSFYTFSIASYIFDIYYGKYKAETSIWHFALFATYFPSLVQGPINRFNQLNAEFFEKEHNFDLKNTQFAIQRILWGFLKKLVIADRAATVVSYFYENHQILPGYFTLAGLLFYAIELYADFAGGMDIALGVSELFGIKLAENFKQPYFSTSIADFWRRWHITLGTWMKDYVFYPFSISNTMLKVGKKLGAKSKYLARVIPMSLGNILVFIIVGLWHGAEWHFIFYGFLNGFIIAFSIFFKPAFDKMKAFFHINDKSKGWKVFQIIRTFILVNFINLTDDVTDLGQSWSMFKRIFNLSSYIQSPSLFINFNPDTLSIAIVLLFTALWFAVSVYKEASGKSIRKKIATFPLVLRWCIYIALVLSVPYFEAKYSSGFMYANF